RLLVSVLGGAHNLGERRVVVVGVDDTGGGAGDERQTLHVDRLVGVPVGVLGPHDDRRRGPVRHTRAVEDAELAGHDRRGGDGLHRDLTPELRTRVHGTVLVVLPRDAREDVLQLVLVDAVLLRIRGR